MNTEQLVFATSTAKYSAVPSVIRFRTMTNEMFNNLKIKMSLIPKLFLQFLRALFFFLPVAFLILDTELHFYLNYVREIEGWFAMVPAWRVGSHLLQDS